MGPEIGLAQIFCVKRFVSVESGEDMDDPCGATQIDIRMYGRIFPATHLTISIDGPSECYITPCWCLG